MKKQNGNLILYYGPMFSGKSEKLIDNFLLIEEKIAFKPKMDNRTEEIYSRNNKRINCNNIDDPRNIINASKNYQNIFIDEVQFFNKKIVSTLKQLLSENKNIYVSGLEYDYRNKGFKITKKLKNIANKKIRLAAKCSICGKDAFYTGRLINGEFDHSNKNIVVIEHFDDHKIEYLPLCSEHHPRRKND